MNKKDWENRVLIVSKYYSRLYHVCNAKVWNNPIGELNEMEKKSEKKYQSTFEDFYYPLGVSQSAKLFAVQHVFEGLTSNLDVNNILHIKLECYYGQAIANEYRKEIEEEFSQEEIGFFLENIDYAKMQEGWD